MSVALQSVKEEAPTRGAKSSSSSTHRHQTSVPLASVVTKPSGPPPLSEPPRKSSNPKLRRFSGGANQVLSPAALDSGRAVRRSGAPPRPLDARKDEDKTDGDVRTSGTQPPRLTARDSVLSPVARSQMNSGGYFVRDSRNSSGSHPVGQRTALPLKRTSVELRLKQRCAAQENTSNGINRDRPPLADDWMTDYMTASARSGSRDEPQPPQQQQQQQRRPQQQQLLWSSSNEYSVPRNSNPNGEGSPLAIPSQTSQPLFYLMNSNSSSLQLSGPQQSERTRRRHTAATAPPPELNPDRFVPLVAGGPPSDPRWRFLDSSDQSLPPRRSNGATDRGNSNGNGSGSSRTGTGLGTYGGGAAQAGAESFEPMGGGYQVESSPLCVPRSQRPDYTLFSWMPSMFAPGQAPRSPLMHSFVRRPPPASRRPTLHSNSSVAAGESMAWASMYGTGKNGPAGAGEDGGVSTAGWRMESMATAPRRRVSSGDTHSFFRLPVGHSSMAADAVSGATAGGSDDDDDGGEQRRHSRAYSMAGSIMSAGTIASNSFLSRDVDASGPAAGMSWDAHRDNDATASTREVERREQQHTPPPPPPPQQQQQQGRTDPAWTSVYGDGLHGAAWRGSLGPQFGSMFARQPSCLDENSRQNEAEEDDEGADGDDRSGGRNGNVVVSASADSYSRCGLDRKDTMHAYAWVAETGKGRVFDEGQSSSSSRSSDDSGDSDSGSDDGAEAASGALAKERQVSFFLGQSLQHRRRHSGQEDDSDSSDDVIANDTSSDEDHDGGDGDDGADEVRQRGDHIMLDRVFSCIEKFSDSSDEDEAVAPAPERPWGRSSAPVPPAPSASVMGGWHGNGQRMGNPVWPSYQRPTPSLRLMTPQQNPQQQHAMPPIMSPAWGVGGGARAAAYLHRHPSNAPGAESPTLEGSSDMLAQLADFTMPVETTGASPAPAAPSVRHTNGPSPRRYRKTRTDVKVHDLLGFDPESEITSVRSPVWRCLPR
ncbi:hypothetical protein NESM_000460700 [Novymonas esmeraldas]|uniref:Uncharacterized protein n=1 Tax=Novymonas esmeraldas TaxID=1808958 RepID=A0AAW0EQ13_9TRYP